MKRMAAVCSAVSAGLERLRSEPDSAFVTASDLATRAGMSAEAAGRCLRREAARPDGSVRRVARGLYWWCGVGQAEARPAPDAEQIGRRIAGPGCGATHFAALNRWGLSTQIAGRAMLAVVGRRPVSPQPGRIWFFGRGNQARRELDFEEVTFLEAMLCTGRMACVEPWWPSLAKCHWWAREERESQLGQPDPPPPPLDPARHGLIREVAGQDRMGGRAYLQRVDQWLDTINDAYICAAANVARIRTCSAA